MITCKDWKTGVSTNGKESVTKQTFIDFAAAGIEVMELALPKEQFADWDFEETARWSAQTGVALWSVHLPFGRIEYNIAHHNHANRKRTLEQHAAILQKAATAGFRVAVVHGSAEPIAERDRPVVLEYAMDSLRFLADKAAEYGITLALEVLPRTCLGNTIEELEMLLGADDRIGVCFDTNHLLTQSNMDFIEKFGERIVTIHASDYDLHTERHWMPGEGEIDWPALVEALAKKGYAGPFLFEVMEGPKWGMVRRALQPSDFKRAHLSIAAGENPKAIGFPSATLRMERIKAEFAKRQAEPKV